MSKRAEVSFGMLVRAGIAKPSFRKVTKMRKANPPRGADAIEHFNKCIAEAERIAKLKRKKTSVRKFLEGQEVCLRAKIIRESEEDKGHYVVEFQMEP